MPNADVPFLDLLTVHRDLHEELLSVFKAALDTAGFIGGPMVQEFERDFAEFCESRFCVGMASGTDALRLALAAAGAVAALAGVLVGFPSLRLKGPYLAIATLGFGVAVYQIFVNWEVLSGGRSGLAIAKLKPVFGLSSTRYEYYVYLALLAGFTLVTYNLVSSYVGRAFVAIRDSDIAAEVNGVNLTRYKLLSFAISSFYTGVHGALYAQVLGHIEPQIFNIGESLTLFVAVIIGGVASIEGSILGALFVILVPKVFANFREMVPVVYGVTILVVLIFEPLGLFGRWLKTRLYFQLWPFR